MHIFAKTLVCLVSSFCWVFICWLLLLQTIGTRFCGNLKYDVSTLGCIMVKLVHLCWGFIVRHGAVWCRWFMLSFQMISSDKSHIGIVCHHIFFILSHCSSITGDNVLLKDVTRLSDSSFSIVQFCSKQTPQSKGNLTQKGLF